MITHQTMLNLTQIKRGSMATHLPNLFCRKNAQLYAELLKKAKP